MKNFCIWSMSGLSRKNPKLEAFLKNKEKYYESKNEFELALKQITDPTIKNAIIKLAIKEDRRSEVFTAGNRLLVERLEKNENGLKKLQEMTEELTSEMRAAQTIANLGSGLDSRKRPRRGVLKL